jgi:hypothetical protein
MIIESDDIASVLAPTTITTAMVSSVTAGGLNLTEDSTQAWNAGATYAVGARVHVASTHRVYESVKDGNLGKDPTLLVNQVSAAGVATWWIDIGPTNKFAMFDSLISTPTVAASPLTFTIAPGAFNGLAMFGIDADQISVTVRDPGTGTVIYSYSAPLEGSPPADYYEYFFEGFRPQKQFIATGIEPYSSAQLTVTLSKVTGTVKLGMLAVGDRRPLGAPLRGASVEPVDYSYVSTDAFGNTTIRRRPSATGLSIRTKMDNADANDVLVTVQELLSVPVVVFGSTEPGYENLTVFGLMSGRLQHDDYLMPTLNITVKGLI